MKQILLILLISILVDNFCMSKFLGICPFLGVSRKVETAIGMGMAVTFVMVLASIITWLVQLLLVALNIKFAQTIAFILVIAALVQFVEMVNEYNLIETIFNGLGGALGFTLAIVLFAGIRERLELSDIPKSFEGFPIALVSASLMAIAFLGFSGLGK